LWLAARIEQNIKDNHKGSISVAVGACNVMVAEHIDTGLLTDAVPVHQESKHLNMQWQVPKCIHYACAGV